jgi:hypothetical protein
LSCTYGITTSTRLSCAFNVSIDCLEIDGTLNGVLREEGY